MKILKLMPFVAISFLLFGCGKEEVSCTNEEALNLLKAAYKEANTSKSYIRYNNKYGFQDYNTAIELLKNGNVTVPNNKLYHEDNEDFLSVLDNLKISFDNIITNEVDKDVNAYSCTTDVFYEFKNKEGELVNLNTTGVSYYVFPMNDGEKIGIQYNEGSIENTRVDLVKYLTHAAGLVKPFDIAFTNEELKIIDEQAELRRLRIEKAEQEEVIISDIYVRLSDELHPSYLDTLMEQYVEQLIADTYFNGKMIKGSDVLIKLYAEKNNLDINELKNAQVIVGKIESGKTATKDQAEQGEDDYMTQYLRKNNMYMKDPTNSYTNNNSTGYDDNQVDEEQAAAQELISNTNNGIYNYVGQELISKFNGDNFGVNFCKNKAFEFIGKVDVEDHIAIKICDRYFNRYGPQLMSTEIPFLYSILNENGLYLQAAASTN